MKIWLRVLLICFGFMYAMSASAGFFDAFVVPPEPTPEEVAAQKVAESKAKEERMKDPLIIKAAVCNPVIEGLDSGIWRTAYAGYSYPDFKFTQLNDCDVTKEQWSAIQKRMKEFYVYKKKNSDEYIFRMGEWEAEKPLLISEYENKKSSMDAQLNVEDESERRKNPNLAKAFDCTIVIPEGQKHWRDFSGQFVYAPDCKLNDKEKSERIALLNSTYYPYLPVAHELSRSEIQQRLEDGSDAFLKDMSYFSNQASAAQSLKRAELLKSGKMQVTVEANTNFLCCAVETVSPFSSFRSSLISGEELPISQSVISGLAAL